MAQPLSLPSSPDTADQPGSRWDVVGEKLQNHTAARAFASSPLSSFPPETTEPFHRILPALVPELCLFRWVLLLKHQSCMSKSQRTQVGCAMIEDTSVSSLHVPPTEAPLKSLLQHFGDGAAPESPGLRGAWGSGGSSREPASRPEIRASRGLLHLGSAAYRSCLREP